MRQFFRDLIHARDNKTAFKVFLAGRFLAHGLFSVWLYTAIGSSMMVIPLVLIVVHFIYTLFQLNALVRTMVLKGPQGNMWGAY